MPHEDGHDDRPGTPPTAPRQGAARLLRFATTLAGDAARPASWEAAMARSDKREGAPVAGCTDHQVARVKWQDGKRSDRHAKSLGKFLGLRDRGSYEAGVCGIHRGPGVRALPNQRADIREQLNLLSFFVLLPFTWQSGANHIGTSGRH